MQFESWKDFETFESDVKNKNRYIHCELVVKFLNNIRQTLPERIRHLNKGSLLFRSQIGYEEIEFEGSIGMRGFSRDRMKPLSGKAREGRANPKGISYLYLSEDEITCMAELRPHIGEQLSVAEFEVVRDLKIVDCYSVKKHYTYLQYWFNPPETKEEIICAIWSLINNSFSKPIKGNETSADYVPTQILTELFKDEGFDGICFQSSLGKGRNFVLFNLDMAEVISCMLMETKSIDYCFSESADRYYVQK